MKFISLIGIAAVLCVPALASAQRGGGAVAVQRGDIQRVDIQRPDARRADADRTRDLVRDVDIRRRAALGDDTGTRIRRRDHDPDRRRVHDPARRRWNAANPPDHHARRRWNAANPPGPDPSRRRGGR